MKKTLITAALACTAAASAVSPASAAILPGVKVDGPSNLIDVNTRPDVDVAPDGSTALVYMKTDAAQPHPFISRFVNGAWTTPQRVDPGSNVANSNPRIAVANGGKVVVTYIRNNAAAVARISPAAGTAFGAEQVLKEGGDAAYVDLSPNGNGYAAIVDNTDVFAQRLAGQTWAPVGAAALDASAGNQAGDGNRAPAIAASPDGAGGAIAWGEETVANTEGEVYVRRLTGTTAGNALPTRAPLGFAPGSDAASGKVADQPAVDMDASGTIWVVFRQNYEYGAGTQRHRAIARSITGTTVGTAQLVDKMGSAPTEGRDFQQIDVNGAGQGLLTHHGNLLADLEWASLAGGTWTANGLVNLSDNASVPAGIPALGENGSGMIAYAFKAGIAGTNTAKARTTFGGLGAEIELSNPAFGALVGGVDAATGSGAFAPAVFTQQANNDATTNRIVAAIVDLPQPPGGGGGAGGGGGGGGGTNPPTDTVDPDVTGLALSAKRFRLGSALPTVSAVRTGTTIRFSVSEASTVKLRFRRAAAGRRVAGRCVKPTRRNRSRRPCTRLVRVRGSVSRPVDAGARRIRFAGRLSARRSLRPGRYQLVLTATDAAGNVSTPDRARFTLLPRKRRR